MSKNNLSDSGEDAIASYPKNASYGTGIYRRRIRLEGSNGKVYGALEDTQHGFAVTVYHDGIYVTDIKPDIIRTPYTSCSGANKPLMRLVNTPINNTSKALNIHAIANSNCTHLLDLTILAILHCSKGNTTAQFDITITDETSDKDSILTVTLNGEEKLCWHAREFVLTSPESIKGKPLYSGFGRWASAYFEGDDLEYAFLLQKGYFVSNARHFDMNKLAGEPANVHRNTMLNVCYTYSENIINTGVRTADTCRDFTNNPDDLLAFS